MLTYAAMVALSLGVAGWLGVGVLAIAVAKWVVRRAFGVALVRPL